MSRSVDLSSRQVGESYKDYAARMAGVARAAEIDRDSALVELREIRAENKQLRAQHAAVLALHREVRPSWRRYVGRPDLVLCDHCGEEEGWPCPTVKALRSQS